MKATIRSVGVISALTLVSGCEAMKELTDQRKDAQIKMQELVASNPFAQAAVLREYQTGKIKKSPSLDNMASLLRADLEQQGIKVGTPFDTFMN
ncbi:MAG: hypothetical protein NTX86_03130 [Candidatus Dependentiae bacterium]|nr:hypothetical protein [Candidatus Dependentiae bacterium]